MLKESVYVCLCVMHVRARPTKHGLKRERTITPFLTTAALARKGATARLCRGRNIRGHHLTERALAPRRWARHLVHGGQLHGERPRGRPRRQRVLRGVERVGRRAERGLARRGDRAARLLCITLTRQLLLLLLERLRVLWRGGEGRCVDGVGGGDGGACVVVRLRGSLGAEQEELRLKALDLLEGVLDEQLRTQQKMSAPRSE